MIDLRQKPFHLDSSSIKKVHDIVNDMSLEDKIGQIFCPIGNVQEEKDIIAFIDKYKPGAMMYRPLLSKDIKEIHKILQNTTKIPLMLAANLESGGNGICLDGTYYARQMSVAATHNVEYASMLGDIAGSEANAVGCNWSFAPIIDIDYNFLNPITNIRTFGSDKETIKIMAQAQIKSLYNHDIIPCIKHFPGDGVDMRDQHLLSSVNDLSYVDWMNSYGDLYKTFINQGIETIMVGHMLLPNVVKHLNPNCKDEDIVPSSLSADVLNTLLRNELGFNGLIVTDATAMIGYNVAMPRSQALPLTIENGCDMILFNKNIDEDYQFIRDGLKNGLLSEERLDNAVLRIIATKMSAGLFELEKTQEDISVVGCKKHHQAAYKCTSKAITLVKNKENILPINNNKVKRIRIYNLDDHNNGGFKEVGSQLSIANLLREEGFEVIEYDYQNLNFYEIFETGVSHMKDQCDLVIYVASYDTASNQTTRRVEWVKLMAADAPWFMQDIPSIFISLANPYHLFDVPMMKTFINCYTNNDETIKSLVKKLIGKEEFTGVSPVDAYCGKWDTRR